MQAVCCVARITRIARNTGNTTQLARGSLVDSNLTNIEEVRHNAKLKFTAHRRAERALNA